MKETKLPRHKCRKCGHEWIPRRDRRPAVCPVCKRREWDKEKARVK